MPHSFALSSGRVDLTFGSGGNNSVTNLVNIICDDIGDSEGRFLERVCRGGTSAQPRVHGVLLLGWEVNRAKGLVTSN